MLVIFYKYLVGDTVYHGQYGWGKITQQEVSNNKPSYQIEFESKSTTIVEVSLKPNANDDFRIQLTYDLAIFQKEGGDYYIDSKNGISKLETLQDYWHLIPDMYKRYVGIDMTSNGFFETYTAFNIQIQFPLQITTFIGVDNSKKFPEHLRSDHVKFEQGNYGGFLRADIYAGRELIGEGGFVDFYTLLEDGYPHTQVGHLLNQLKYQFNDEMTRESMINELSDLMISMVKSYGWNSEDFVLVTIPSSKDVAVRISQNIAMALKFTFVNNLVVYRDPTISMKSAESFEHSLQLASHKYKIDMELALKYRKKNIIVVDDIFGKGGSVIYVLMELFKATQHKNYFIMPAKDTFAK